MDELIRRSDAIEAVMWGNGLDGNVVDDICEKIEALPSADRPRGEWENYKDEHLCSNCREVVIDDWYDTYDWYDFCPHCGARMKGADDDL